MNRILTTDWCGSCVDRLYTMQSEAIDKAEPQATCTQCGDPCSFDQDSGIWRHHTGRKHAANQTESHDDCVGATYALYRDHRLVYCGCGCYCWGVNNQPEDAANPLAKFETKE